MIETLKKRTKKQASASTVIRYAIKGIEEKKGNDIVCINLKKIPNHVCDYFVICEGSSRTQVQAIAESVEEFVEKNTGARPWHIEGLENGEWVLLDYVDVVVHIFQPEIRLFYNLESMWADAEIVSVNGKPTKVVRKLKKHQKEKLPQKKKETKKIKINERKRKR